VGTLLGMDKTTKQASTVDLVAARAQPDPEAVARAALEKASAPAARAVRRYFQSGDEKKGDHLARIVAVEVDATNVAAIIEAATKGPTP